MSEVKVSILIPIYGVEKYIERCARSLFSQTMTTGIEFIFVDDCSKDESIDILKRVIEDYPFRKGQIKIIPHERNQGLAVARVTGVMAAQGKYVAHCDSDDWVEPDMYESLLGVAEEHNSDIVVCDYCCEHKVDNGFGQYRIKQSLPKSREESASAMLCIKELHPYLWIRLIKREFYIQHKFFANPSISFCEDMAVTIPMHLSTDKVHLISRPLYHYNVINSTSMTKERSMKKIESCLLTADELEKFVVRNGFSSVVPALNHLRFLSTLPLITCLEIYNPQKWLELDIPNFKIDLMLRSKMSVWLVRHKMFKINKIIIVHDNFVTD